MAHWETPRGKPRLEDDEVHVWRISLRSIEPGRAWETLSDEERRRAARHRFAVHRTRFVAGRAALRAVLSAYLGVPPTEVPLVVGAGGKPRLADGEDLDFNLAHSEDVALVAVTRGRAVGVDVERLRRGVPYDRLARRFFAPCEAEALRRVPTRLRPAAFFACWTRKEAWLKASGHGLERGLPSALPRFAVSVEPRPTALAITFPDRPEEGGRWSLVDVRVGSGYAGALAVEGPLRARFYRWSS
ncbi:MAG: 4'-phosphopantetheinyl transferase family protein [Gemmatimonadota bacterium]